MNSTRYIEPDDFLVKMIEELKKNKFPALKKAKIKVLLDKKPKKSKGRYRMAEIKPTDELCRYFTQEAESDGYDFIMIFDESLVYEIEDKNDLKRIIFHELNHAVMEEGKPKTVPHEFEGFYCEQEFNKDKPDWNLHLTEEMHKIHGG